MMPRKKGKLACIGNSLVNYVSTYHVLTSIDTEITPPEVHPKCAHHVTDPQILTALQHTPPVQLTTGKIALFCYFLLFAFCYLLLHIYTACNTARTRTVSSSFVTHRHTLQANL